MPLTQEKLDTLNAPYKEALKAKEAAAQPKVEIPVVEIPVAEVKAWTPIVAEVKVEKPKEEIQTAAAESDLQKFLKENNISSLDELKNKIATPAKEKSEKELLIEAVNYGLQNNKIKPEDYEEAIKIQSISDYDVALADFTAKQLSKNSELTKEEIQNRFDKKHGDVSIDETSGDRKVDYDKSSIKEYADEVRSKKFSPIENLRKEFDNYQVSSKEQKAVDSEINTLKNKIPKSLQVESDGEKYDIALNDKTAEQLKHEFEQSYRIYAEKVKDRSEFNLDKFLEYSIWSDPVRRNDALTIIKNGYADKKVSEALLPYKNQQVKPLDSGAKQGQSFNQEAELQKMKDQRKAKGLR